MSVLIPLRDKILKSLNEDPEKPISLTIKEHVQPGVTRPYMVMGDKTQVPHESFARTRDDSTITFTVYSDYKGDQELLEINEWLMKKLHNRKMLLDDGTSVRMRSELMTTGRTVDGVRQLINRFRMVPR